MRKAFHTLLLATIAFAGWRAYALWPVAPCTKPIEYSLGAFDGRFGVSQAGFLVALQEAEAVWEEPLGLDLFTYASSTGSLKVNLVYDYRQKTTKDLASIDETLKKGNAQYREFEEKYQSLKATYDALKIAYDTDALALEAHQAAYEQQVEAWNEGPRRSKTEFEALQAARVSLEAEAAALKTKEAKLNDVAKLVNNFVGQLNGLAKDLNAGVLQYNEVGHERGETFTGGLYTSDEDGERIDVFEFETHEELVHVLAHELGHALGLEHVDDPKAVMYPIDQKIAPIASAADIAAAETLCHIKEIVQ